MSDGTEGSPGANGAGQAGAAKGGGGSTPEFVLYTRFQEVVREKQAAVAERDAARAEGKGWSERAATADTLAEQLRAEKDGRKADRAAWDQERTLLGAGLADAESQAVALAIFGALPEEQRKPGVGPWLAGLRAEGATIPRGLQPYLGQQQPAAKPGGQSAGGGGLPRAIAGGTQPPAATSGANAQAIRAAREQATKTGDWTAFNNLVGFKP